MKFRRVLGLWRPQAILGAGLLLVLPLLFSRSFPEQFSYPKKLLAEVLVIAAAGAWAAGVIWGKVVVPRHSSLIWPLAFLAVAVLLSCLNSPVPTLSLVEAEYFLCGPLWLVLLIVWGGGEARMRTLAVLVAAAGTVVAVIALLQWSGHDPLLFGGYRVVWGTMVGRMRLYSTFGNPNFAAGYLIGAIFLALALAGVSSTLAGKTAWCASVTAIFAAIIGMRSRGAWLGLAAGLLMARFVWRGGAASTRSSPFAAATPGIPSAQCLAVPAALAFLASSLGQAAEVLLSRLEGRVYLWRVSWPMFAEHPLLGSGWASFQLRFLDLQALFLQTHPDFVRYWSNIRQLHNDPLQILLESGALGLVAMGWVWWAFGREARRALAGASRSTRLWIGASAGGTTAILVNSFFNFQLAIPPTLLLLFSLLAFPSLLLAGDSTGKESSAPAGPEMEEMKLSSFGVRVVATLAVVGFAALLLIQVARRTAAEYDYMLALGYERQGEIARAEQVFRQGLKQAPLHGRLRYGLARALYLQGMYPAALAEAELAGRTYADSHLEMLKARIQDQMGLAGPALETYRHALALDPTLKSVQADIERLSGALADRSKTD
jgi:O-antigen ligase